MTLRLSSLAAAFAVLCSSPLAALAADAVSPVGSWQLSTGESRYDVVECGSATLCARLTWLREDERTVENLALLDTYVVKAAQVRENKWKGSAQFEGNMVDASVTLVNGNTMRLTGCRLLCQTMTLNRIGTVASR
jgi:uncharacterized protein (DUF2147 family)